MECLNENVKIIMVRGEGDLMKPYVIIKGGVSQSLQSLTDGGGGSKIRKIALCNLLTAPYENVKISQQVYDWNEKDQNASECTISKALKLSGILKSENNLEIRYTHHVL